MSLSEHAMAAKILRGILKDAGVKGKVHSETYSGGSSITATLINPTIEQQKSVEKLSQKLSYGHFDGMTDMFEQQQIN